MDKGADTDGTSKEEIERLKVENQYMRSTLEILHKNIIVRDEKPQMEIQPPDVLKNDQELIDLTTRVANGVSHKFYSLEMELDDTYGIISHFFTMIGELDRGIVTQSPNKTKCMSTGRKVRGIPPQASERSKRYMELEKVLKRISSTWWDMKEKERVNHHMEMNVHATEQVEKALQATEQKTEEIKVLQEVIEHTTEKMKQAVEALEEKKGEFTLLEKLKQDLESSHKELQKTHLKTLKDNLTLKERKTQLKSVVLGQESVILTLQQNEKSLQKNLNLYNSKLKHYEHSVKQLNEEKEDLLNRLSVFASDRLTHEDTRITDLSDPDRPTRLSDVYSELYDYEWTDAYEELIGKGCLSPEGSIELLREMLLKAFQTCRQITWDRYEAMKTVTVTLDNSQILKLTSEKSVEQQEQRSEEPMDATDQGFVLVETTDTGRIPSEYTTGQSCEDNIDADYTSECTKEDREKPIRLLSFSIDEEKEIKKVWKITSNAIKTNALEVLRSLLVTYFKINAKEMSNLTKYLTSCLELCWKMGIQEKPMHLDTGEGKDSNSQMVFDQVRFKAYTKPGKNVAYIVWPALCLYKGGDIVNKGVAQGC